MSDDLLAELKQLQRQRGDSSPFTSHVEFLAWTDTVSGLLSTNPALQKKFHFIVENAKFHINTNSSPINAINEAIGVLNQAITAKENKVVSLPKVVTILNPIPNPATELANAKLPPSNIPIVWYQKPIGLLGVGVAIMILGAIVIYLIKTHFGIPL